MTDAEADFGITHNDHFQTEEWRVSQVHRIQNGIPNMMPPELSYTERPSRRHSGWVAVVVGVVLLGLIVLQIVLIGS